MHVDAVKPSDAHDASSHDLSTDWGELLTLIHGEDVMKGLALCVDLMSSYGSTFALQLEHCKDYVAIQRRYR